ncbi:MarR family winged helix-turn-helix transcriptional regulator [Pseudonocardia nantongensis]|uniref:MarR family winged helix-turn-helix transcriptional regulator n=1 Tax=Pseudonocardia nantongensis TaxID=1181885 RepID=UPI00397A5CAC
MTDLHAAADLGAARDERTDVWPELASAVHELSRVLRSVGERGAGLDAITGSEVEVLRCVSARPGSTVSAVSRALGLQPSNVSTTVRSLIGRDLLERRSDPADGRRALLHPTARARRHRTLLDAAWSQGVERALTELPGGDAEALRAAVPALARLAGALEGRRDLGAHPPG